MTKVTIPTLLRYKREHQKFISLTAYSYPFARALDEAGVPLILVGDSLGMVELGYPDTTSVTLEDMIHHGKAVVRGCSQALVIIDMPFMQVGINPSDDFAAIRRIMQQTGASGVKIEGATPEVVVTIRKSVEMGVPVLGHIGLLPQQIKILGKYALVGKEVQEAELLLQQAKLLEEIGVFGIVLECVVPVVAKKITAAIKIPTIGIGSGADCDGQILVTYDLLGFTDNPPKHAHPKVNLKEVIQKTVSEWGENKSS